jgi:hypothetical protein
MLLLGFIFFSLRINYDLEEARCPADKRPGVLPIRAEEKKKSKEKKKMAFAVLQKIFNFQEVSVLY